MNDTFGEVENFSNSSFIKVMGRSWFLDKVFILCFLSNTPNISDNKLDHTTENHTAQHRKGP